MYLLGWEGSRDTREAGGGCLYLLGAAHHDLLQHAAVGRAVAVRAHLLGQAHGERQVAVHEAHVHGLRRGGRGTEQELTRVRELKRLPYCTRCRTHCELRHPALSAPPLCSC